MHISVCVFSVSSPPVSGHSVSKLALFENLTEAFAQFEVALVLGTLDELPELVRASLLLRRHLLLVHGLRLGLVRLLISDIGLGSL